MDGLSKSAKKNLKRAEAKKAAKMQQEQQERRSVAKNAPVIVWFRADLRTADNPALFEAAHSGDPVIPVFIRDDADMPWPVTGAAAQWLHHSLLSLNESLCQCGLRSGLVCRQGEALSVLLDLLAATGARTVSWNNVYEPWLVQRDDTIEALLRENGITVRRHKASVLYEPWEANPDAEQSSLVDHGFGSVGFFTRACRDLPKPGDPLPTVTQLLAPPAGISLESDGVAALGYGDLPHRRDGTVIDWASGIREYWEISEQGAHRQLARFLEHGVFYFEGKTRFRADQSNTAIISPYVRFGQLSSRTVQSEGRKMLSRAGCHTFLRRLAWRDLAYWALWKFPHMADRSLRPQYEEQRWDSDRVKGQTGFPLVDAAMRQLWSIGWMPNYLRHVTAGFLVEFLNMDWKHGLAWYHDTLVDSDIAINAYMWQNGGHSGLDQWNFVMHPIFAAKSADPEGEYVREWCPELAKLPVEFIHCPWEARSTVLAGSGVVLGRTYPRPIVASLEKARLNSLDAVVELRSGVGASHVLKDGNEKLLLDDGREARLITRVDFREMASRPITEQRAADKWDKSKRDMFGPAHEVMRDSISHYEKMEAMGGTGVRA